MDIIIKYANRKFYSKVTKAYINLEDILHKYVLTDKDFVIIDYVTGNDITQESLLHGLVSYNINVPIDVLKDIVKTYGITPIVSMPSNKKLTKKPIKNEYNPVQVNHPISLDTIIANVIRDRNNNNAANHKL